MFLDKLGVMNLRCFMENYTTTLGDRIYVPFEIGGDEKSLVTQLAICTHEHQHVCQWRKDKTGFIIRYLADRAQRALYEAEAMLSSLETYAMFGETRDARKLADKLKHYNCNKDDREVAYKAIALGLQSMKAGGVTTKAGRIGVRWLESRLAD